MTMAQIRLFLREGEKLKRHARAAFVADVYTAAKGVMGEGDEVQKAIKRLTEG